MKPATKLSYTIIGLILLPLLAALLWFAVVTSVSARWSGWVNDVQIACQQGSDEVSVRLLLGEPSDVRKESLTGIIPSPPSGVENADRVLLYSRYFFGRGIWFVHVYLNNDGNVVAYHISKS